MTFSPSYSTLIIVGISLVAITAVILNAVTLGVLVHRFNRLEKENNNNETEITKLKLNLVEAIRIEDVMEHLSQLYRIAMEENQTRAFNTTGFNRTIDYINNYLSVHTNFQIKKTDFFVKSFELTSDPIMLISINNTVTNRTFSSNLSAAEYFYADYSGAIHLTDFLALTAIPNLGCTENDWLDANPSVQGRIALVKRGNCTFLTKVALATKYNATSILIYNDGISTNPFEPLEISLDRNNQLPTLFLSFNLGQELASALENPLMNTSARILIDVADTPLIHSANICADTPTGDITQTIVVGSHSDSVPAGPGINDNGSGSAANLAIAVALYRLFQSSSYPKYKSRIRFCWWGAEEIGLLGSDFYVRQAENSTRIGERLSDNLVNINFDMLGSPNYVFGIYDGQTISSAIPTRAIPGSKKVTGLFREWFNHENLPWNNSTLGTGSDYAPFLAAGIAAGGLLSGASGIKTQEQCDRYASMLDSVDPYCIPTLPYDPCYHQSCDSIWNIHVFAYEKMVKAGAYVIESLGRIDNLTDWLYPSEEINQLKYQSNSRNDFFGFEIL